MFDIQEAKRIAAYNKDKPAELPYWLETCLDGGIHRAALKGCFSTEVEPISYRNLSELEIRAVLAAYSDYHPTYNVKDNLVYLNWEE